MSRLPFTLKVNVPAAAQDRWEQIANAGKTPPLQIIRYASKNQIRVTVMAVTQVEAEAIVAGIQEAFIEAVKPKDE